MKNICIIAASLFFLLIPCISAASQWCGFGGIYIGQNGAEAKKKGFSVCVTGANNLEKCASDGSNKAFSYFYGTPIKNMEVAIRNNKVSAIWLATEGPVQNRLEKNMTNAYGEPSAKIGDFRNRRCQWIKRNERILLNMDNGKSEVLFSIN